jgi:nucleoside-diphosphate-sugar epimerase
MIVVTGGAGFIGSAFICAAVIFTLIPMINVRPRRSSAWGIALRL